MSPFLPFFLYRGFPKNEQRLRSHSGLRVYVCVHNVTAIHHNPSSVALSDEMKERLAEKFKTNLEDTKTQKYSRLREKLIHPKS